MIRPLPKRIARIAPIGSLLKHAFDHGPQRRSIETPADPAYLEMIRQLPCIKCGMEPCGEAAHVDAAVIEAVAVFVVDKMPLRWPRDAHAIDDDAPAN